MMQYKFDEFLQGIDTCTSSQLDRIIKHASHILDDRREKIKKIKKKQKMPVHKDPDTLDFLTTWALKVHELQLVNDTLSELKIGSIRSMLEQSGKCDEKNMKRIFGT